MARWPANPFSAPLFGALRLPPFVCPMLTPHLLTPAAAPDLTLRRFRPTQAAVAAFGQARAHLLASLNPAETEENAKTHVRDFLRTVLGASAYYVNTRTRRDLVVRTGPRETDPVGVVLEVKAPANAAQMVTPTDLNRRAFHELLLYYLEDRLDHSADHLRRLVITNGTAWFVFDAQDFDRLFWRDTGLRKAFTEFKQKGAASKTTEFFYESIARPFLANLDAGLPVAYVELRTHPTTPAGATQLWRLLSAHYLLKEPVAQDANTLNRGFYEELLYLIGLEEVKDGGRKLIQRCAEARRQPGTLLENALTILTSEDGLAVASLRAMASVAGSLGRGNKLPAKKKGAAADVFAALTRVDTPRWSIPDEPAGCLRLSTRRQFYGHDQWPPCVAAAARGGLPALRPPVNRKRPG